MHNRHIGVVTAADRSGGHVSSCRHRPRPVGTRIPEPDRAKRTDEPPEMPSFDPHLQIGSLVVHDIRHTTMSCRTMDRRRDQRHQNKWRHPRYPGGAADRHAAWHCDAVPYWIAETWRNLIDQDAAMARGGDRWGQGGVGSVMAAACPPECGPDCQHDRTASTIGMNAPDRADVPARPQD